MDRKFANAFVLACDTKGLLLDFFPYLVEVSEAFVDVQELSPFRIGLGAAAIFGRMDKLEYEGSSRYNSLTSREEIASNNSIRFGELL